MSGTVRGSIKVKGFQNDEMDFQLLRQLGSTTYGGSSVGEALAVVDAMTSETPEEWVSNFVQLATRQEGDAKERLAKGHDISAREQFLKASNSFRAAEYYAPITANEHVQYGLKSRDCFLNYLKLVPFHSEVGFVEYNQQRLPYYFIAPSKEQLKRKTVIVIGGFDATLEELFIQSGIAAITRGYNVVCFAGPGQMDSFRFNENTYFEHDFEKPVAKLLDLLTDNSRVNQEQIMILGFSFGGYFASRACCYERRIKALIANSPVTDLKKYVLGFYKGDPSTADKSQDFSVKDLANIPDALMPPNQKKFIANFLRRFGNKSMFQTMEYLDQFNIYKDIGHINCPTLALIGEGEGGIPLTQYNEFMQAVNGVSDGYQFKAYDGADTHCQVSNFAFANCVIYDWLDEVFA